MAQTLFGLYMCLLSLACAASAATAVRPSVSTSERTSPPPLGISDLDTVLRRYLAELLQAHANITAATVYAESLTANGSWPDIDYGDRTRTEWAPTAHLSRLQSISRALVRLQTSQLQGHT